MSDRYVLALDAGSSGGHALVADLSGRVAACAQREWSCHTPPDIPLGREFDADGFWDTLCQLARQAISEAGIAPESIVAASTASQRMGVVFLDADGRELYAGPNTDIRALAEGLEIDSRHGEEVRRITGHMPSFLFAPARLKWFEGNRPDIYKRISTVFSMSDWMAYRLSGRRAGELSGNCDAGLVDIHGCGWSPRLVEMLGLPPDVYPLLVAPGTRVGEVTAQAAGRTGLARGTAVVAAGADTQCGLLGMGVVAEGQVGIVAGWSAPAQMVTGSPIIDAGGRMWACCHLLPHRWVLESNAGEAGGLYCWLESLLCGEPPADTYELIDGLAQGAPAGASDVIACVGPKPIDMGHLGPLLGGFIFPMAPSAAVVQRQHLARAALENLCFALRAGCERLAEVSGIAVKDISVGGGLARSRFLLQVLSSVLNRPLQTFEMPHVSALGAAMCAAAGVGAFKGLEAAMAAMRPRAVTVEPDPQQSPVYERCYRRWLDAAGWLEGLNEKWCKQVEL